MSGVPDAFEISAGDSGQRLYAAARWLTESGGRVLLDGNVVLRRRASQLECGVIDRGGSMFRCENEYAALIENARHLLEGSTLYALLPGVTCRWRVVTSPEPGAEVLWQAPKPIA